MKFILLLTVVTMATSTLAQVSLDDVDRAMKSRGDEMADFRLRVEDPDPNQAMAAILLLIEKGDPLQRQMAIEHGLSRTDSEIRLAVVAAIFNTRPVLVSRWYPEDGETPQNFRNNVANRGGTISPDNIARVPLSVGSYYDDADCWLIKHAAEKARNCLFRLNSGEASFFIEGAWTELTLDAGSQFRGSPIIGGVRTNVVIDMEL